MNAMSGAGLLAVVVFEGVMLRVLCVEHDTLDVFMGMGIFGTRTRT